MTRLQSFGDHIWTVFHPLTIAGMKMGTRMTIIALPSKRLLLINPVPIDDALAAQIEALGPVDTVVAPNLMHHLYFGQACQRWPKARALVAPGLGDKVDLVDWAVELGHRGSIEDAVHWHLIDGAPRLHESVFVDPRDEVLIITDIAFHYIDHPQWWLRVMMRLNGIYGRFGPSRIIRQIIDDDRAFGTSLVPLFDYDWDAAIVAHGEPIKSGARRQMIEAFRTYLPDSFAD